MTRPPRLVSPRGPGRRGHLPDVLAMRLADGEPVPIEHALHAAACGPCAGAVARFAAGAAALKAALALDQFEVAFLHQASLPQRLPARTSGRRGREEDGRDGR